MKRVSIVILNWNGKAFLELFLPSLVEHTTLPNVELVVADNASTDDSLDFLNKKYPEIRTLVLDENYGFAGGYNRALAHLDSKYYLLLNSDIEVSPNWLEPLVKELDENEKLGAVTPKIKDHKKKNHFEYAGAAGGYIDKYGYPFCRGRIFDELEEDLGQYDDPCNIFWGSGAALLVRSSVWKETGGLDERFFAHMEEIDLCWRMKNHGYEIRYVPGSTVYHVGGGTLQRGNPRKTYLNFRNNLLLLYKNLPAKNRHAILFTRKVLDGISALRFLLQGAFRDFWAVFRAHMDYSGMKSHYKGLKESNNSKGIDVIASGIYPGSIVISFFLKRKKKFSDLQGLKF